MNRERKSLNDCINTFRYHRICPEDCADALYYMEQYKEMLDYQKQAETLNKSDNISELENKPLTWDEIRQMDDMPVWFDNLKDWDILTGVYDNYLYTFTGLYFDREDCGIHWNAYRYKHDKNDPLTLDEMRQMVGKPVFALDLWYNCNFWHIIQKIDDKYIYFEDKSQWPLTGVFCDEPSHLFFRKEVK